jgi:hypothetical protein
LVEDQYSLRQTANQYSKLYSQIIQDNWYYVIFYLIITELSETAPSEL